MAHDEGLTEGEHVVLRLHPHWKTVLRPVLLLALIVVHTGAALWHHFIKRDRVTARMVDGAPG